jgi:hypothetical protein
MKWKLCNKKTLGFVWFYVARGKEGESENQEKYVTKFVKKSPK